MHLNKVLFVNPDYHNSRTLAKGLNKIGIQSNIWIPLTYNRDFIFESDMNLYEKPSLIYLWHKKIKGNSLFKKHLKRILHVSIAIKKWLVFYKYGRLVIYGDLIFLNYFPDSALVRIYKKYFGKIYYVPSGCRFEAPKSWWANIENGSICSNCGFEPNCDEKESILNIAMANQHATKTIGFGFMNSPYLKQTHIKYKSFELNDEDFETTIKTKNENVKRFFHSYSITGRALNGKNIKGTDIIKSIFENLKKNRSDFDYEIQTGIRAKDIRNYQKNFDVIIDQLHYGWWGSTTLEALSLGIPVMCHLKKDFIDKFERNFNISKEELPIINVSAQDLKERITDILDNPQLLDEYKSKIPNFLNKFLDADNNISEFIKFIDLDNDFFPREQSFLLRVNARSQVDYIQRLHDIKLQDLEQVIDFGCGYGQWSFALAQLNRKVVAIDVSEYRLEIARKTAYEKGITNIDFVNPEEFERKYSSEKFDGFFSYSVLHLIDQEYFFSYVSKFLKPNGIFYFTGNSLGWYLMCLAKNPNASWDYSPRKMAAIALMRKFLHLKILNYRNEYHHITSDKAVASMAIKHGLSLDNCDEEGSKSVSSLRFFVSPYKKMEYVREYLGRKYD